MDDSRFDQIARAVGGQQSRRQAMKIAAGFVLAGLGIGRVRRDASGQAAPCVLTCPANITVSNDPNQCGAVVNYAAPSTSGDCGAITCAPASGSFFPVGTTTVTCSEVSGPTCSFTVTVNDTQPPSITCPANAAVPNDLNQCGAVATYPPPTASDNCPGVTTLCTPASGSFWPVGTTTTTCTATDAAGNTATCSFTMSVADTQAPAITCPADIAVVGVDGTVVDYDPPVASDNCPGVVPVCSPPSGSAFPEGTTTVTCTATDASQVQSTCTFAVTVTPPTPTVTNTPVPPTPVPTTAGGVTQLPNTGSVDEGASNWWLPAGLAGAGAALAARLGWKMKPKEAPAKHEE